MAGGGLYALVAYGTQNVILSGNPQMTYFYKAFKRYSHFAMENITIPLEGPNEPGFDTTVDLRAKIPRYGDLMSDLIFSFHIPDIYSKYIPPHTKQIGVDANNNPIYRTCQYEFEWVRYLGVAIINRISFSIGGQKIQEFDGSYLLSRALLDQDQDSFLKWRILVGDTDALISPATSEYASYSPVTNLYSGYPTVVRNTTINTQTNRPSIFGRDIHVPLSFWFSDAISKALPLIGLQYHECEVKITLNPISQLYTILDNYGHRVNPEWQVAVPQTTSVNNTPPYTSAPDISGNIRYFLTDIGYSIPGLDTWQSFYPRLQANFIYLPREEQIIFATRPLSYLISQMTTFPNHGQTGRALLDLQAHNPLTRMMFVQRRSDAIYRNDFANFTNWYTNPNYPFTITPGVVGTNYSGQLLPGMQREMIRSIHVLCDGNEIQETKNTDFFTEYSTYKYVKGTGEPGLPFYSFQLNASVTQPSGSLNASRIRNFQVDVDFWPLPANTTYVYDLDIYVENINFLEIVSGMGGLKYAL